MMMKPQIGISVDGACEGNPGIGEWQGKDLETGKIVFKSKKYENCTNNVAEFLACVHALAYCEQHHIDQVIYSDSVTARAWVRDGCCGTGYTTDNTELQNAIERANKFLSSHTERHIETWRTKDWGDCPADFGRKGWFR